MPHSVDCVGWSVQLYFNPSRNYTGLIQRTLHNYTGQTASFVNCVFVVSVCRLLRVLILYLISVTCFLYSDLYYYYLFIVSNIMDILACFVSDLKQTNM